MAPPISRAVRSPSCPRTPERDLPAFTGKLITCRLGMRFLTDDLRGDIDFRVHRAPQNLDRRRTQVRLVESILQQEEAMQKFADSW